MNDKPYFECPVEVKNTPDGGCAFHITLRDKSVVVVPGPPGVPKEHLATHTVRFRQREGSDQPEQY